MVDPEEPMRAGQRGALGVANSRGDSRPGGGGCGRERRGTCFVSQNVHGIQIGRGKLVGG